MGDHRGTGRPLVSDAKAHPGVEEVSRHLEVAYGIEVLGLAELDLRVYRVDRAGGAS